MNLALEYLVRTGAIRKFLQLPCSLCVQDLFGERTVVCLGKPDRSGSLQVTHFHLAFLDENGQMPLSSIYSTYVRSIFDDAKVVIPGHLVVPFAEQPIDTGQNRYNQPMSESIYEMFVGYFFNPESHQKTREVWLWKSFRELHLDSLPRFGSIFEQQLFLGLEKSYVRDKHPRKWATWCSWKRQLLVPTNVAAELVFKPDYERMKSN